MCHVYEGSVAVMVENLGRWPIHREATGETRAGELELWVLIPLRSNRRPCLLAVSCGLFLQAVHPTCLPSDERGCM